MQLSPDGGATPAKRRKGDQKAQYAAYRSGMVFRGKLDIPVIDWRHYLEPFLDMHHSHQSFATRQRLLNYDGDASNQVIWFTAVPAPAHRRVSTRRRRRCSYSIAGSRTSPPTRSGASPGTSPRKPSTPASTWTGRSVRAVRASGTESSTTVRRASALRTSRRSRRRGSSSGGPIEGSVFKCQTQSVDGAIERGLYGEWQPTAAERARLQQIFPTGVCDYTSRTRVFPLSSGRGTDERKRAAASSGRPCTSDCATVARLLSA